MIARKGFKNTYNKIQKKVLSCSVTRNQKYETRVLFMSFGFGGHAFKDFYPQTQK